MEWVKKDLDTLIILGAFLASLLWINGKFKDLEKDLAVIEAAMVMKNIIPVELAYKKYQEGTK